MGWQRRIGVKVDPTADMPSHRHLADQMSGYAQDGQVFTLCQIRFFCRAMTIRYSVPGITFEKFDADKQCGACLVGPTELIDSELTRFSHLNPHTA